MQKSFVINTARYGYRTSPVMVTVVYSTMIVSDPKSMFASTFGNEFETCTIFQFQVQPATAKSLERENPAWEEQLRQRVRQYILHGPMFKEDRTIVEVRDESQEW